MIDERGDCSCPAPGAPLWTVTLADMMCILLSFFVLLFSFANTDAIKFKGAIGSMKEALGAGEQPDALLDLSGIPKRPDSQALETRTLAEASGTVRSG